MVISIQLMTKGVCELKLPEEKVPRTSVLLDIVLRHFLSYLPCYTIANGGGILWAYIIQFRIRTKN